MGSGGFYRLRMQVAKLVSPEFGEHYKEITDSVLFRHFENPAEKEAYLDELDQKTEQMIRKRKVSVKVVDFLMQPDTCGSIRYGACKQLLKVIGDYDDEIRYGYAGKPNCAKFSDFREILKECVEAQSDMLWS